jgi:hypothetical protein
MSNTGSGCQARFFKLKINPFKQSPKKVHPTGTLAGKLLLEMAMQMVSGTLRN